MMKKLITSYKTRLEASATSVPTNDEGQEKLQSSAFHKRSRGLRHFTRLKLLACGVMCVLILLPSHAQHQASAPEMGARGGVTLASACGHPKDVFTNWHLPLEKLPKKEVLVQLPSPHASSAGSDLTYDPQQDVLCATSVTALYVRYVQPQPTALPGGQPSVASASTSTSSSWSSQWVTGILKAICGSVAQGLGGALQKALEWARELNFMFSTPPELTYSHPVVKNLYHWVLGIADGVLIIILMIAGYNYMLGRSQNFRELIPVLIYSAIAVNLSLAVLGDVIEVHNGLCSGLFGELKNLGLDKTSVFWGTVKWVEIPIYVSGAYVLELLMGIVLMLQMLLRLALLDLLLVLAPVGIICFTIPQLRAWGQLWVQGFASTLIVQFLQVLCVNLGSALIASAQVSLEIVAPLVGLASFYMAFRIPDMLLSNVLRASHGNAGRNISQMVQTIAQYIAMVG